MTNKTNVKIFFTSSLLKQLFMLNDVFLDPDQVQNREQDSKSLYELNNMLRKGIRGIFPEALWVQAEIAECNELASGHCYLELVEKQENSDKLRARAKAVIWSNVWLFLHEDFMQQTGTHLQAGQKILMLAKPDFHELYGLSLVIQAIDPAYTLGEWSLRRRAVLHRLEQEGVSELNKELSWPRLPQRLAVISSPTAAGYEDFMHQLQDHPRGYVRYTCLFPALMQGVQAESSILTALDRVMEQREMFDLVVIIRGGGAMADLSCFDSYELSSALAQFPLPLLLGIGHERDRSVADMVAHTSVKTPTAAAEKILSVLEQAEQEMEALATALIAVGRERLNLNAQQVQSYQERLLHLSALHTNRLKLSLQKLESDLRYAAREPIQQMKNDLNKAVQSLKLLSPKLLAQEAQGLDMLKLKLEAYSPDLQMKRGFSITLHRNKILRSALNLPPDSLIETRLPDGSIFSKTLGDPPNELVNKK